MNIEQTKDMILAVCDAVIENKPLLTEVDSKIGDGDHGIGMALGMGKVKERLLEKDFQSVNEVFQETGMTMLESMGGASGVIFSALFFGGLKGLEKTDRMDGEFLTKMFRGALETIKKRGKAQPGDKTMVDALEPAVAAMEETRENWTGTEERGDDFLAELLKTAAEAADGGVEKTKQYTAKFGRAKSLMERSIGYQDAGATSVAIIFHAMAEYTEKLQAQECAGQGERCQS